PHSALRRWRPHLGKAKERHLPNAGNPLLSRRQPRLGGGLGGYDSAHEGRRQELGEDSDRRRFLVSDVGLLSRRRKRLDGGFFRTDPAQPRRRRHLAAANQSRPFLVDLN